MKTGALPLPGGGVLGMTRCPGWRGMGPETAIAAVRACRPGAIKTATQDEFVQRATPLRRAG